MTQPRIQVLSFSALVASVSLFAGCAALNAGSGGAGSQPTPTSAVQAPADHGVESDADASVGAEETVLGSSIESSAPSSRISEIADLREVQVGEDTGASWFTPGHYATDSITARIDPVWLEAAATATDIPPRALAAYAGASQAVLKWFAECGIGWNTLAGIGQVESYHGRIFDGQITDAGQQIPPVYGIALTGETTASIPDTDGGVLDADDTWDRAVGPMQFIPQTWLTFGADGNGDGVADPQHIDDAALAAAVYLCYVGGDLRDGDSWIRAVASYNPSVAYNNRVASAATEYLELTRNL